MIIDTWQSYEAPAGSKYRLTLVSEIGDAKATDGELSIIADVFDNRPSVDVLRTAIDDNGHPIVDVQVFASDSLPKMLGAYASDGDKFWKITVVERIDSSVPGTLGVLALKYWDQYFDKGQSEGRAAQRAATETGAAVQKVATPFAIGSVALLAIGGFLYLKR